MSEAIIVRGGIAAGGNVDLSWVNSSLSSINGKIDTVNSKLNTMNNRINNAVSSAGDAANNTLIFVNSTYLCEKTGNYQSLRLPSRQKNRARRRGSPECGIV